MERINNHIAGRIFPCNHPDHVPCDADPSSARAEAFPTTSWRNHSYLLVVMALLPIFWGIYYSSYWLRFDGKWRPGMLHSFHTTVGWIILTKLAWFVGLRACRGWNRLVTFYDLILLLGASLGGSLTAALIYYLLVPFPAIPRSVLLLDWGTTIVVGGGLRALSRGWREAYWLLSRPAGQVRVLVAGVGETKTFMLRAIRQGGKSAYRVVGFLARDRQSVGLRVEGIPVVGTFDQACRLVPRYGAQQVLVVQGEFSGTELRKLMEQAERRQFELRVLPDYRQLIEGKLIVQPRPVSIEDLLQRKPVSLDIENIRQWIDGRVVLVTGSAGSIGSEICRQLTRFSPRRIVAVDRSENGQFFLEHDLRPLTAPNQVDLHVADVLDTNRMRNLLKRCRPQVLFHAAAYKHVPLMENHPGEAVRNIVAATRRLADLAGESGVGSFVLISTDKAVNPTSVMGACKRAAELYLQSLQGRTPCRWVTVRFGNVLDSAGSVVPLFRQQIASGGPVTVTHPDIRRYFMTIPEAARLVIQAGAIGEDGQILLLDMGEPIRIADLAADMIRLSGLRLGTDIDIEYIGLRPGEKLYEELHFTSEKRLPTRHPKIIIAQSSPLKHGDLLHGLAELERLAQSPPPKIIAQLQKIVPEYQRPILSFPVDRECDGISRRRIAA
jgi:FlaA1/EpsC-like NDP-sugar epimerase